MAELVDAHDQNRVLKEVRVRSFFAHQKIMELKEINSLVELFFDKFEQLSLDNEKNIKNTFLVSLKDKNKNVNFFLIRLK